MANNNTPSSAMQTNVVPTDRIRADLLHAVKHMDDDRGWRCNVMGGSHRPPCVDSAERETQWTLAVVTVTVVALLQLHRLLNAVYAYRRNRVTGEYLAREFLIALLSLGGMSVFWRDVNRCAMYEGILKLVAIVGLSNILLPCLWLVPPPPPPPEEDHLTTEQEAAVLRG
jgi:hypothetical protein